jgi:anti-sigma factor RsiW
MSDYLDGDLAAHGRTRLERHVGACQDCNRLLASLRELLGALQAMPAPAGGGDPREIAAIVRRRMREPPAA